MDKAAKRGVTPGLPREGCSTSSLSVRVRIFLTGYALARFRFPEEAQHASCQHLQ